jgi:thioredoxin-like negative regulator of GroEL
MKTLRMTELTIDQALQKGIQAHKDGQVQEANRLYTAILRAQPKHPDANHNMGVLAVGIGKVEQALPFFKIALEANPATAQFWLSYIDALIKLERLADAKAVLDQAKSKGAKGDGFDKLEQRLKEMARASTGQADSF